MLFVFLSSLFLFVILPEKANMSFPGDLLFWVMLTILVSYILYWFYRNSDVVKNLYGQYVCK